MALMALTLVPSLALPQDVSDVSRDIDEQSTATTIGGKWYINFRIGEAGDEPFSRFGVGRGYIIIRHRLTERLSGRITPDVSMDREGDGEGDLEVRLKYCFLNLSLDDLWIFTQPRVEFGLAHRPWLDYEEHVNTYRVQGTMFLERNDIFNSGDYGVTVFSLLGGSMDEGYLERVNSSYAGRYGSMALGVYNGGGYHAIERNTNKTIEGRLTVRPLPDFLPGLQFSYQGVYGAGNDMENTKWTVNLLFASWESEMLVITGQYYWGAGNFRGTAVDANGTALRQQGYSVFGEWHLPGPRISLIGRYDCFDHSSRADGQDVHRVIAGLAYELKGASLLLVDYDIESGNGFRTSTQRLFKFAVEFGF